LTVTGVRCFSKRQEMAIRPVTILVGENSTGKSTVLAMARAGWEIAFATGEPNFNEQPFDLGAFDAIAHFGGRGHRAAEFTIETDFEIPDRNQKARARDLVRTVRGTFGERVGQPFLRKWSATQRGVELSVEAKDDTSLQVAVSRRGTRIVDEVLVDVVRTANMASDALLAMRRQALTQAAKDRRITADLFAPEIMQLLPGGPLADPPPPPFAIAPIRSKPERTYDPKRGIPEPEGSHVPMDLAALYATAPDEFKRLTEAISEYGREGNLFTGLEVKRLGKKPGDPFQLLVRVGKHSFNLRDVGYGVSQVLPILVDVMRAPSRQTFLLQQPEVHLHPRAQATLGSLIAHQAGRRQQTFIVETHSDYLLDRVRMEVRERDGARALSPDDITVLYFERVKGDVIVHSIKIDDNGELRDVPAGYRSFFLNEERRLLGL
jgi:predicted ATPase